MEAESSLEHVQSHGVCSVRHVNGICVIPKENSQFYEILSPLGPTLQRWEVRVPKEGQHSTAFTRLGLGIPLHRDAITCLVMIPTLASNGSHLVLSTSYSGQIRLWSVSSEHIVQGSVQVPQKIWEAQENDASLPVMHVSVLGSRLAVSSFRRYSSNANKQFHTEYQSFIFHTVEQG
jgi:WD40 repeat protein